MTPLKYVKHDYICLCAVTCTQAQTEKVWTDIHQTADSHLYLRVLFSSFLSVQRSNIINCRIRHTQTMHMSCTYYYPRMSSKGMTNLRSKVANCQVACGPEQKGHWGLAEQEGNGLLGPHRASWEEKGELNVWSNWCTQSAGDANFSVAKV